MRRASSSTPFGQRLAECLDAVTLPLAAGRQAPLERIRLAWAHILGPTLSRHAEPLGFEDGLLIIGARGDDWREALFVQRASIRRRLRRVLAGSRGFKLRTLPRARPAPRPAPPPPIPVDARTADIADDGLRDAMAALLAARTRRAAE